MRLTLGMVRKSWCYNWVNVVALYASCFEQTIPCGGYVRRHAPNFKPYARLPRQSMYDWLDYESKTLIQRVEIWHERNHGEVTFANYRVDGYSKATGECWEFDGCFYHSCRICNNGSNDPKDFQEREKHQYLKELLNLTLHVITMCEFKRRVESESELRAFVDSRLPPFYRKHGQKIMDVYGEIFGTV